MESPEDGEPLPPDEIDLYEDARMRGLCEEGAEEVVRERQHPPIGAPTEGCVQPQDSWGSMRRVTG